LARCQEWTVVSETCNGILIGVGADGLTAFSPASDTAGNLFAEYGTQADASTAPVWDINKVGTGMALDAAINSKKESYFASMLTFSYSNDSTTFTKVEGLSGASQSIGFIAGSDDSVLGAVGSFKKGKSFVSGVATVSSGKVESIFEIPTDTLLRYGAFPSSNVWYVSGGSWPADDTVSLSESEFALSKRVSLNHDTRNSKINYGHKRKLQSSNETWSAEIQKTTDGGKTWTNVFTADPATVNYYFNQISCSTESQCVVVGEGNDANGTPLVVVYTTTDGGATWTQTLNDVGSIYSLTAVNMIPNTNLGWMGATVVAGRTLTGAFYTTSDAGMTWTQQSQISGCQMILNMDFTTSGSGYATCLSASGSKGCIGEYIK